MRRPRSIRATPPRRRRDALGTSTPRPRRYYAPLILIGVAAAGAVVAYSERAVRKAREATPHFLAAQCRHAYEVSVLAKRDAKLEKPGPLFPPKPPVRRPPPGTAAVEVEGALEEAAEAAERMLKSASRAEARRPSVNQAALAMRVSSRDPRWVFVAGAAGRGRAPRGAQRAHRRRL